MVVFFGGNMNKTNRKCPMFRPCGVIELLAEEEADINFARIGTHAIKKMIPGTRLLMISDERGVIRTGDSLYQILPVIIVKQKDTLAELLDDEELETAISLMKTREQMLIADGREVPAYQL